MVSLRATADKEVVSVGPPDTPDQALRNGRLAPLPSAKQPEPAEGTDVAAFAPPAIMSADPMCVGVSDTDNVAVDAADPCSTAPIGLVGFAPVHTSTAVTMYVMYWLAVALSVTVTVIEPGAVGVYAHQTATLVDVVLRPLLNWLATRFQVRWVPRLSVIV